MNKGILKQNKLNCFFESSSQRFTTNNNFYIDAFGKCSLFTKEKY